jgi:translation initiation factor IF-3
VKIALKFRGRENAHTEVGFEVIKKFIADIAPYGQPDFQPKLVGKAINLMISPLPRNKRAKNPHAGEPLEAMKDVADDEDEAPAKSAPHKAKVPVAVEPVASGLNDALARIEVK